MAASRPSRTELDAGSAAPNTVTSSLPSLGFDSNPPTHAAFSPTTSLTGTVGSHRRITILLHQKSPLLLATPPQITRALAYSHPFLTPINTFLGLVSWTTGDPWESFLLVAAWWAVVLYGDLFVRIAGPLVVVAGLILGMYGRRFTLLSSSGWSEFTAGTRLNKASSNSSNGRLAAGTATNAAGAGAAASGGKPGAAAVLAPPGKDDGKKHKHNVSKDSNHDIHCTRHQKTLDEIVATLRELTTRCNILLEPLLEMTDFLSTQRTATTASTRPALTTLFVRLLFCTPVWWILTLPPLRIITTRRVMLVFGTIVLTWHARVMRVARAILWRSRAIRKIAHLLTGLQFEDPLIFTTVEFAGSEDRINGQSVRRESELTKALRRQQKARRGEPAGVRFTFIIYENQRRWVGLGWTTSLFSYERAAWTDEHNNPVPPKDEFELPEVEEGARAQWRWAEGSRWRVDGVKEELPDYDSDLGKMGWLYYDNKWQNGRRGQDGWGRWTRRRKWYRDAELVELSEEELVELNKREEERRAVEAALAAAEQMQSQNEKEAGHVNGDPKPPPLPDRRYSALPPQISAVNATRESNLSNQATLAELADTSNRSSSAHHIPASSEASSIREMDTDATSIMSTSSRSRIFESLRKRSGDPGWPTRHRRTSEAASEDADASLGPTRALQIQGAGRSEDWMLGDEAKMSLE